MTGRIVEFARALRDAGVRVSLAESLDACEALKHIPVQERADFRLALRCALVKDPGDFATFDFLFEKHFRCHRPRRKDREPHRRTHRDAGTAPSPGGSHPGRPPQPDRPPTPAVGAALRPGPPPDAPPSSAVGAAFRGGPLSADADRARQIAELAADLEEGMGEARRESTREARERRHDLRRLDLKRRLSPEDSRLVAAEVEKLARKLASRESLRLRRARRGKVDLKATLARGVRTGGIPFQVVRRRRSITRTKLVVLCDVSGSVWNVATFLLRLVHLMQSQFARTHSLVFVDRPVDVTALFGRYPFDDALQRLRDYPDLDLNAYSDFGNTFYELLDDHPDLLDRDTVLLVLGDARTNQFDPMEWTLEDARRHVRRVVWLNPEPRERWDTADSAMSRYAPSCDAVLPCGNLEDLATVARRLLSSR